MSCATETPFRGIVKTKIIIIIKRNTPRQVGILETFTDYYYRYYFEYSSRDIYICRKTTKKNFFFCPKTRIWLSGLLLLWKLMKIPTNTGRCRVRLQHLWYLITMSILFPTIHRSGGQSSCLRKNFSKTVHCLNNHLYLIYTQNIQGTLSYSFPDMLYWY